MNGMVLGVALAVFFMVTLGLLAATQVFSWFFYRDALRVRQRMAFELGKGQKGGGGASLYPELDRLDLDSKKSASTSNPEPLLLRVNQATCSKLETMLEHARVPLSVRQFFLVVLGVGFGFGLSVSWLVGFLAGIAAGALGTALPFLFVNFRRKARQAKMLQQLPNAFDLMARVIRAGQSVPQAFSSVAQTFEDPIAGEFASCQQQQNLGLRPDVALQEMVQRCGILELRIFAMAMMIQRQTGGNLAEVLERLAALIRTRLRLLQQVKAWTAEGRLQGWTLVVLPFLMFAVLMFINRKYVQTLFDHLPLVAATLASMGIGILWIRRIVNFRY